MELSWRYRPLRRRFLPGNVFFENGDIECGYMTKQIATEEAGMDEPISELDYEFEDHEQEELIVCGAGGCDSVFEDTLSYESHYNSCHRNVCSVCNCSFPSSRTLDCHLEEKHDVLFSLMATSSMPYQCVVSGCSERFASPSDRRDHLIAVHQYPHDFVFIDKLEKKEKREAMETDETGRENTPVVRVPHVVSFGRGAKMWRSHRQRNKGKTGGSDFERKQEGTASPFFKT
ncbi:zinc finger protein 511-like [Corticium candelabrum]|uniref:zinc finger protein 511-like n=1 Tax=Corticium candelabrum TaxID=121492 RepID=UPI002E25709E|nr:zinc finger protein 511-like [Corticium candelabrum]